MTTTDAELQRRLDAALAANDLKLAEDRYGRANVQVEKAQREADEAMAAIHAARQRIKEVGTDRG